jgi:hypothetical protein
VGRGGFVEANGGLKTMAKQEKRIENKVKVGFGFNLRKQ